MIKRVALIGLGTMGPGIAARLARGGLDVAAHDVAPAAVEKAKAMLGIAGGVLDRLGIEAPSDRAGSVRFAESLAEAVEGADLVIENVPENIDIKAETYRAIDRLVGASVIAAPMLWAMGFSQSLLVLAVLYVGSEFVLSAAQGPLAAVLPDRVPIDRRGTYSAGLGMGIMLGSVVGTVLASVLSDNTVVAYLVIGSIPVIMALSRLLVAGDADNRGAPVVLDKVDRGWRSFVVSPSEHPDFWWAIGSRSLTYAGFFTVQGYALYLLQDYIGLGDDAVDLVAVSSGIAALCIVLAAVPSGILSDRVGRRKPFVVAASGTMAAGFIIPLIFPTVAGYLAMIVVMALSFGCFESTDNALVTQVLPRESAYAQDLGVVNVAAVAPQILAPALAGSVVVLTSEYVLIFPLAALFALLGAYSVTRVRGVR